MVLMVEEATIQQLIVSQSTKKGTYMATTFRKKEKEDLQLPFQWESREIYRDREEILDEKQRNMYVRENLDGLH